MQKKSSLSLNLKLDLTGLNRTEMGFAILSNLAPSPPVRVLETPQSADVKAKEHLAMGLCYLFLAKYESSTI